MVWQIKTVLSGWQGWVGLTCPSPAHPSSLSAYPFKQESEPGPGVQIEAIGDTGSRLALESSSSDFYLCYLTSMFTFGRWLSLPKPQYLLSRI